MTTTSGQALYTIGQLVSHRLFQYRGVIVDVDPYFMLSEEWYKTMAKSRPPRDQPWYRVLVHNAIHETYVAERNPQADDSGEAINHPEIDDYFSALKNGFYQPILRSN